MNWNKFVLKINLIFVVLAAEKSIGKLMIKIISNSKYKLLLIFNKVKGEISCNFDGNFCGYNNQKFILSKGRSYSSSVSSGPVGDRTTGNGYYALCRGEDIEINKNECKLSQNIKINDDETNISFWYYMYGFEIGTLKISDDTNVFWNMTGKQEKEWLNAVVKLPKGEYNVKF